MGGSDQWATLAPLGAERDLIAVDLPGFGRNAAMNPVNSIAGFADWVLSELSRRGITRFDLLGHSMGGMVTQKYLESHQAPAAVLLAVLITLLVLVTRRNRSSR